MANLEELGIADNTIFDVTTENGTEVFTWPDGGNTPFKGTKGMTTEGGFRVPMVTSINTSGHKFGMVYPGVGFLVSAVFALVLPGPANTEAVTLSITFTLLGAIGFLVGSLLMLPEASGSAES